MAKSKVEFSGTLNSITMTTDDPKVFQQVQNKFTNTKWTPAERKRVNDLTSRFSQN